MAIDNADYNAQSWQAGSKLKASDLTEMSNTINRIEDYVRSMLGNGGQVYTIIKDEVATVIGAVPSDLDTLEEIVKVFEEHKVEFADLHHIVVKHESDIAKFEEAIENVETVLVSKADITDVEALESAVKAFEETVVADYATKQEVADGLATKAEQSDFETLRGEFLIFKNGVEATIGKLVTKEEHDQAVEAIDTKIANAVEKSRELEEQMTTLASAESVQTLEAKVDAHVVEVEETVASLREEDAKIVSINNTQDQEIANLKAEDASIKETLTKSVEELDAKIATKADASDFEELEHHVGLFENETMVALNSKATSAELAEQFVILNDKIEANEDKIEANVKAIAEKAVQTQFEQHVTDFQAKIDAKVEQEVYDAKVESIETRLTTNEAKIVENAEGIAKNVEELAEKAVASVIDQQFEEHKAEFGERIDAKLDIETYEAEKATFAVAETVDAEIKVVRQAVEANELAIAEKAVATEINAKVDALETDLVAKIDVKADKTAVETFKEQFVQFENNTNMALGGKVSTSELANLQQTINDKIDANKKIADDGLVALETKLVAKIDGKVAQDAYDLKVLAIESRIANAETAINGKVSADDLGKDYVKVVDYEADKVVVEAEIDEVRQSATANGESIGKLEIAVEANKTALDAVSKAVDTKASTERVDALEGDLTQFEANYSTALQAKANATDLIDAVETINAKIEANADKIDANVAEIAKKAVATEVEAQFAEHEAEYQAKIDAKADAQSVEDSIKAIEERVVANEDSIKANVESIAKLTVDAVIEEEFAERKLAIDEAIGAKLDKAVYENEKANFAKLEDLPTVEDFAEDFASAEVVAEIDTRLDDVEAKYMTAEAVDTKIEEAKPDLTPFAYKEDVELEMATKAEKSEVEKLIGKEESYNTFAQIVEVEAVGEELGDFEVAQQIVNDNMVAEIALLKKLIAELQAKHEDVVSIEPVEEVLSSNSKLNVGGDLTVSTTGTVYGSRDAETDKIVPISLQTKYGNVNLENAQLDSVVMNVVAGEAQ